MEWWKSPARHPDLYRKTTRSSLQAQLQLRLQLHDPIDFPVLLTAAAAASAAATDHHLCYRHSDDIRRFPRLDFGHDLVLATLTASNKCVLFSFPLYRTPTYLPTSLPPSLPAFHHLPTYLPSSFHVAFPWMIHSAGKFWAGRNLGFMSPSAHHVLCNK